MLEKNVKEIKKENYVVSQQEVNTHYVPSVGPDGKVQFVPCTEEFFRLYMNELRKEKHEKAKERRCLRNSERYNGMVRCLEDCDHCPFCKDKRDTVLSIDRFEEEGIEFADEDSVAKDPRIYDALNEIEKLSESDQRIINLYLEGNTDEIIAETMQKTRDAIKKRRQRLFAELRKKLED